MKYRWSIAPTQPALAAFLARELRISPLLAQCLLNRGMSEPGPIGRFLEPRLKDLSDPFLLPNMRAAVERLFAARERGERLVVFGDYDVDGVTSTALLTEVFGALGWQADYYLPHRMDEGYGLSQSGVENCLNKFPVTLLLAVDCGSTAVDSIRWLRERGVDVIVLDHHQVSSPAPDPFISFAPPASPSSWPTLSSSTAAPPACRARILLICDHSSTSSPLAPSRIWFRSRARTASWFPPASNASMTRSGPELSRSKKSPL